jgi:predicted membrane protein
MSSGNQFDPEQFSRDLHDKIHRDVHERIRRRLERRDRRPGMLPGVILVIIGTIILLDHMGIFPAYLIWRFWPAILIVAGLVRYAECPSNRAFSVMLMFIGAALLLGNLGLLRITWAEMWPLALIAAGIAMIWGRMSIPRLPTNVQPGDPNMVTASAVFGGVERRISTSNFKGGTISGIFGGVELDFRSADIDGEEAVLYVEAIFGGVELVVPERWIVIFEGQSMFAGYNDETRPPLPDVPGAPPKKRLILRGQAIFGGITVKN